MFWMWVSQAGRQEDVTFFCCANRNQISVVTWQRHQRPRVNGMAVPVGKPYHQKGIFVAVAVCQETDIKLQEVVPKALLSPAVHQHLHAWLLWHLALQWSYSSAAASGSLAKWCELDRLLLLDGGLEVLLHHELHFQAFTQNPGKMYKICDNV